MRENPRSRLQDTTLSPRAAVSSASPQECLSPKWFLGKSGGQVASVPPWKNCRHFLFSFQTFWIQHITRLLTLDNRHHILRRHTRHLLPRFNIRHSLILRRHPLRLF